MIKVSRLANAVFNIVRCVLIDALDQDINNEQNNAVLLFF